MQNSWIQWQTLDYVGTQITTNYWVRVCWGRTVLFLAVCCIGLSHAEHNPPGSLIWLISSYELPRAHGIDFKLKSHFFRSPEASVTRSQKLICVSHLAPRSEMKCQFFCLELNANLNIEVMSSMTGLHSASRCSLSDLLGVFEFWVCIPFDIRCGSALVVELASTLNLSLMSCD